MAVLKDRDYKKEYDLWRTDPAFDEVTRLELAAIAGDEREIEDRFYKDLSFGTGGLRGVMGAGTNRINEYTVRKASQGLANYINKTGGAAKGVAIAYDSRRHSAEYAEAAALCFNANGIKTYVFDSLRPTPELSFAIRAKGCIAGIVITASHNPKEYNGYKVYWEDGAQITPPRDEEIIREVNAVTDIKAVKAMVLSEAKAAGLFNMIGEDIDALYMSELKKQIIHPEIIKEMAGDLKIVYTPLNGAGNIPARRILQELGFENVYVVKEQEAPDPEFPTLEYPNPEVAESFDLALKLAKSVGADIVIATDPDADRLGVYSYDTETGDYVRFTGNMSGILIAEYILRERKETGTLPKVPTLVKTIVTTNMAEPICNKYKTGVIEVLTGFKYIGEQIKLFEESGLNDFVFGFEESYGCLAGTHARDKDAIVTLMCLCEVAAWCKKNNMTLWDRMKELFDEFGYYKEDLYTQTCKGVEGAERIRRIMADLRKDTPKDIGGMKVLRVRDYSLDCIRDLRSGNTTTTGLPKSDVLYFELEDDSWCCARPSGTEPKIKFYMGVKGISLDDAKTKLDKLTQGIKAVIE